MKQIVKHALLTMALTSMTVGLVGTEAGAARNKSDTIKPTPPSVAKGKSGVIKPRDDVAPPSAEKGIKDQAVKGCGNCGVTGRVAAPPAVADPAPPPPSVDIETGQLLIKDKPVAARRAHSGPGGTPPSTAAALKKRKGPKIRDDSVYSTPLRVSPPGGGAPSTAKGGKTGWLLGIGGLAAILAVVAASGGGGTPVSR